MNRTLTTSLSLLALGIGATIYGVRNRRLNWWQQMRRRMVNLFD